MRRLAPALVSATVSLLLAGCGCGSEVSPATVLEAQLVTLASEASRDGCLAQGGTVQAQSGPAALPGTGDHLQGSQARRQFFSFDLSSIPAGATVHSALLRLYQARVEGAPYATHGVVLAEHVVYETLDASDYDRPALADALGALSGDALLEVKRLEIGAAVQADLAAGRARTQIRLRWSALDRDGDALNDQAHFVDGEDALATGVVPQLLVTFAAP